MIVKSMDMTKELLTVEFRYHDAPKGEYDSEYKSKTITIGVFDTLEEAITEGNKILNTLSKSFEVRSDDEFKLKHLYGAPKRLVTNVSYPTKGIQYFAKIVKLKFDSVDHTVEETFKAWERYRQYKRSLEND